MVSVSHSKLLLVLVLVCSADCLERNEVRSYYLSSSMGSADHRDKPLSESNVDALHLVRQHLGVRRMAGCSRSAILGKYMR